MLISRIFHIIYTNIMNILYQQYKYQFFLNKYINKKKFNLSCILISRIFYISHTNIKIFYIKYTNIENVFLCPTY